MSFPPPGTVICRWADLQATGTALYRTDRFDGFVILDDYLPRGYVDACPHNGMRLGGDQEEADYMTAEQDVVICRWHGASFLKDSGLCIGGPCAGQHLTPWAVERRGDEVVAV